MEKLAGKTAIVTGGSRGYGAGIAARLKEAGAEVWITGRDEVALRDTADNLGVHWVRADVVSTEDWDRVFAQVMARSDRLDILVNNAGAGIRIAPVIEQSDEELLTSVAVNLSGAMLGCRRAAAIMKEQGDGVIINVSSVCAHHAWPGFAAYSAAKAGMVLFSRCLYTELRPFGVRVTSLIPSWGATNFAAAAGLPPRDPETVRRCIQPDELGDVVVHICSLPPHLVVEEMTIWPLVQEVEPL